jgi:CheY-like chemotaxis protein
MRIAYVEDNPTNLALVERVASMNQHAIVSYNEGEVAKEELLKEKFDLILMDVELAGEVSGLQVVRHIRTNGLETPIVAVTAYAMLGDMQKCLDAGCNDYLPKPLPIMDLLALLNRYDAMIKDGIKPPVPMPKEVTETAAAGAMGTLKSASAPAHAPTPAAEPAPAVVPAPAQTAAPVAAPPVPAQVAPAPVVAAPVAPAVPAPVPTPAPSVTPTETTAAPAPVPANTPAAPTPTPSPSVTPPVPAAGAAQGSSSPARPDDPKPA